MTDSIAHRGPDDVGMHLDGALGLGFRRLSIIDLAGGHQPMSDPAGETWVVFNGEIYNFSELRKELEGHGHRFRTRSDTEVIVHGYRQWGPGVLDRLNGMFGLAIWDSVRRRLMLARDRAGIKPLYYSLEGGRLTFGSEIRPLLVARGGRPEPDPAAINLFLKYRYTPAPLTVFRGIRKLAPGTCMIVEGGEARIERWWRFQPRPFAPPPSPDEARERLLELYAQAVERQLVADVPLGLLLSGGLDSGLLLALMNRCGRDWKSFTVGFGAGAPGDELAEAARTAQLLGADHSEVRIDQATFEEVLPRIIGILEEPVAAPSVVPMYFVCELARRRVKVALMGQGPDELLGGYTRHLGVYYGGLWRALPDWARRPLRNGLDRVRPREALRRGLYALEEPDRARRYERVFAIQPEDWIDALFAPDVLADAGPISLAACWDGLTGLSSELDELGGLQFLEIRSSLPDELLMYADKLSMHHGLELRVPYLDHDVIEYAECLPSSYKVRRGRRKWLHAEVCRRFLPAEVLNRPKRGFAVDTEGWLRGAVDSQLHRQLADPASLMYELLDHRAIQALLAEHRAGHGVNHKLLYSLVALESWLRQFCERAPVAAE